MLPRYPGHEPELYASLLSKGATRFNIDPEVIVIIPTRETHTFKCPGYVRYDERIKCGVTVEYAGARVHCAICSAAHKREWFRLRSLRRRLKNEKLVRDSKRALPKARR